MNGLLECCFKLKQRREVLYLLSDLFTLIFAVSSINVLFSVSAT